MSAKSACVAGFGLVAALAIPGCHRSAAAGQANGADPANANFAPADGSTSSGSNALYTTTAAKPAQVLGQRAANESQQQAEEYPQQGGAAPQGGYPAPGPGDPNAGYAQQPGYADQGYANGGYQPSPEDAQADEYAADLTAEAASEPPPPLPEYEQPPAPAPDYIWTPGYWGWGTYGYYWVPGVWVSAPYAGALWTPGYWGFVGNVYRFHHGFWGPHIGFYGGIDYGFGYTGYGYYGGYWNGGHFFYNTAVNRVNVNVVRNVYVRNVVVNNVVVNNRIINRVSYNGGRGGIGVRPRPAEMAVMREQRIPPMRSQLAVRTEAAGNRAQFYSQNHGKPQIAAAARPVAADRSLPAALPRAGAMMGNGMREGNRPGAPQQGGNPGARGFAGPAAGGARSVQPGQVQNRGIVQGQHPESPRAVQPQGVVRPAEPRTIQHLPNGQAQPDSNRQAQHPATPGGNQPPRPEYGNRGNYGGQPAQPNFRRGTAPEGQAQPPRPAQPQLQPRPEAPRPPVQPQYQQRLQSQPQVREQRPQPQVQPHPQAQPHPQPQPQARPAPQGRNEEPHEERGH